MSDPTNPRNIAAHRMLIYWDGDYWAVEFPDVKGLAAASDTWSGLKRAIKEAKQAYFDAVEAT